MRVCPFVYVRIFAFEEDREMCLCVSMFACMIKREFECMCVVCVYVRVWE